VIILLLVFLQEVSGYSLRSAPCHECRFARIWRAGVARRASSNAEGVIIGTVSPEDLRGRCLSFPGAAETFPFGPKTSVFRVADKMFALSQVAERPLRVSLKCEPALAEQLRQTHAAVAPGYHLNKRHWNTVTIDGSLADEIVGDMVEDSYDLVVSQLSKARQGALGWRASDAS